MEAIQLLGNYSDILFNILFMQHLTGDTLSLFHVPTCTDSFAARGARETVMVIDYNGKTPSYI